MKRNHPDRHELLEDIFAPEKTPCSISAEDVLRIVGHARQARRRRGRYAIGAAVIAGAAAIGSFSLQPAPPAHSPQIAARVHAPVTPVAPAVAATPAVTPPTVEHVDDERMLALLDDRPAALVQWPDGRQSLLLLVANPPAKRK